MTLSEAERKEIAELIRQITAKSPDQMREQIRKELATEMEMNAIRKDLDQFEAMQTQMMAELKTIVGRLEELSRQQHQAITQINNQNTAVGKTEGDAVVGDQSKHENKNS